MSHGSHGPVCAATDDEREVRNARLRDMQSTVNACTALTFVVFSTGTFFGLRAINHHLAAVDQPAVLTFVPGPWIWFFFPFFGGMILSWYLALFVWSLAGFGSTAKEYRIWARDHALSNYRGQIVAMNSQRFFFWSAWLIALPIGVATVLALNMHTAFSSDQMRICGYAFRPCEVHAYSDIRRMTVVEGTVDQRYGKFHRNPYLVLDFSSGQRWSAMEKNEIHGATEGDLAASIFAKTGLTAGNAHVEKDIPPLVSPRLK
jgi:hypothetical protein